MPWRIYLVPLCLLLKVFEPQTLVNVLHVELYFLDFVAIGLMSGVRFTKGDAEELTVKTAHRRTKLVLILLSVNLSSRVAVEYLNQLVLHCMVSLRLKVLHSHSNNCLLSLNSQYCSQQLLLVVRNQPWSQQMTLTAVI